MIGPDGPPVNVRVLASGFADGVGVNASSSALFLLEGTQDIAGAFADLIGDTSDQHGVGCDEFLIDTVAKITPGIDFRVNILAPASVPTRRQILPERSYIRDSSCWIP